MALLADAWTFCQQQKEWNTVWAYETIAESAAADAGSVEGILRTVYVTDVNGLFTALKTAQAGDEIVVAPGTYIGKLGSYYSGHGSSFFNSDSEGTKEHPIVLRSEDPENPALLKGERNSTGNVLRITGDYWIIDGFELTYAQKGIMLDNSNYSVVRNCYIHDVGMEGLHFRDNSSYNLAENCTIMNTGLASPGYGEAVYVGSANNSWSTYGAACNYNTVRACKLGPGVAAEHVDIKEGTTGTVIEECIMDGTGMSGQNYADSFVDIKGNNAVIRGNICYRNNNSVIVDAFQLHYAVDTWGFDNEISENTVYMDVPEGYVINATHDTSAITSGNARYPEGQMYTGDVTVTEATPTPTITPTPTPEALEIREINCSQSGSIPVGSGAVFTVKAAGGEGSYCYSYYVTGAGELVQKLTDEKDGSFTFCVKKPGIYTLNVYVTDSAHKRAVKRVENLEVSYE